MSGPEIAILTDTSTGWGRRVIQGIPNYNLQQGPRDHFIQPKGEDGTFQVPIILDCDGVIARISDEGMALEHHALNVPAVIVSALSFAGREFPRVATDYRTSARLTMTHFRERVLQSTAYVEPLHLAHVKAHERACRVHPSVRAKNHLP